MTLDGLLHQVSSKKAILAARRGALAAAKKEVRAGSSRCAPLPCMHTLTMAPLPKRLEMRPSALHADAHNGALPFPTGTRGKLTSGNASSRARLGAPCARLGAPHALRPSGGGSARQAGRQEGGARSKARVQKGRACKRQARGGRHRASSQCHASAATQIVGWVRAPLRIRDRDGAGDCMLIAC